MIDLTQALIFIKMEKSSRATRIGMVDKLVNSSGKNKDLIFTDEDIQALTQKALLEIPAVQLHSFRTSLGKIVAMFHQMSDVGVCEYKQFDKHTIDYNALRDDQAQATMTTETLSECCPHFNATTHYFDVPAVLADNSDRE